MGRSTQLMEAVAGKRLSSAVITFFCIQPFDWPERLYFSIRVELYAPRTALVKNLSCKVVASEPKYSQSVPRNSHIGNKQQKEWDIVLLMNMKLHKMCLKHIARVRDNDDHPFNKFLKDQDHSSINRTSFMDSNLFHKYNWLLCYVVFFSIICYGWSY